MTDARTPFEPTPLYDIDAADPPDVVYFPVRHYSPTSARILWELAEVLQPTAVLVEGPSDFNDRLDELMMPGHVLPIALYTYVRLSDDTKRSAFYPYCEYAPEWQAQLLAAELEIPFRFIDLPWKAMALESDREHRYSDHHFRKNPYPEALCERMNVGDFDELWDVLFELDTSLRWPEYLRRCHEFCWHLRIFGGEESPENEAREACMVEHIARAREEYGGPVLVVTGGYHSSGLWARMNGAEIEYLELSPDADVPKIDEETTDSPAFDIDRPLPPASDDGADQPDVMPDVRVEMIGAPDDDREPLTIVESGITLTPFTFERIDKLSGYASGVHGPAFYQYVWETRRDGEPLDSRPFLYEIVTRLRDKGQVASTADVIGIESTARALATLRGRREIWRFDLLDAISSALVKEAQDAEYTHPILQVAREVLRGEQRGAVDENAPLPPLVTSVRRTLTDHGLLPEPEDRRIDLDLTEDRELANSRILHQCRVLGLAGFQFAGGTDFATRDDLSQVWEEWVVGWSPEFEGTLIECAVYGSDLREASTARVLERAQKVESDAEAAALIAIDAVLMGVSTVAETLYDKLQSIVRQDTDFFKVADALGHLLYLYRHDEVLGAQGDERLGDLLRETYTRSLWLFESLGTVKDRDSELVAAIRTLFRTFQRCYVRRPDERAEFVSIFGRIGRDESQLPLTRGSAMGAMYTLGELDTDRVLSVMRYFSDPVELGDFLIGFFSLAREAAQRDPRLLQLLDDIVCDLSEQDFLEVLPGLRLAFTFFTPLEKHNLVDALFSEQDNATAPVDARSAAEGAALELRIRQVAREFGLRGVPDNLPPVPDVETDDSSDAGEQDEGEQGEPGEPGEGEQGEQGDTGEQTGQSVGGGGQAGPDGEPTEGTEGGGLAKLDRKERWRLILGAGSDGSLGGLSKDAGKRDKLLAYLYDREYGPGRNVRGGSGESGRRGSLDPSQLTVPDWINGVHELFPNRTIERLEKDALDRYQLQEIVTRPDVLSRATPNPTLLKAVLRTKHLMNKEVLDIARRMVRTVVEELIEKLARTIHQPFSGALDRRRRSFLKVAKNFDATETIRRNLKNYSVERQQIIIKDPYFFSRIRRNMDRWQLIIAVDQSGSMLDSVIHAAVTASIFFSITKLKTHLVAFDTDIVDLTADARDPVETLMGVQLGGGTDIANALEYAYTLIENPGRTIVVLITDFYEGGPVGHLLAATKQLTESGVHLLGLAALDEQANPLFDRETAAKMAKLGAHVGAMTPGELAQFVAEKIR